MLKPHCPNAFRQKGRKGKDGVDVIHHQEKKAAACNAVPLSMCSVSLSSPNKTFLDSPQHLGNHLYYCASTGLFVFIFLLAKWDCLLGSITAHHCVFELF